jgi:hypothetical protein
LAAAACASGGRDGPPRGPGTGGAYQISAFTSGAALLFVQFDADHDYATTKAEVEAGIPAEWTRASEGKPTMTPLMFEAWAAKALGGPNLGPYRLAFDTNVNNEITQEEFQKAILEKFAAFDTDKDGVVRRADMVERLPDRGMGPRSEGGPPRGERRPPPR